MKYKKDFRLEVFFIGRFSPIFEVFQNVKRRLNSESRALQKHFTPSQL